MVCRKRRHSMNVRAFCETESGGATSRSLRTSSRSAVPTSCGIRGSRRAMIRIGVMGCDATTCARFAKRNVQSRQSFSSKARQKGCDSFRAEFEPWFPWVGRNRATFCLAIACDEFAKRKSATGSEIRSSVDENHAIREIVISDAPFVVLESSVRGSNHEPIRGCREFEMTNAKTA